MKCEDIIKKMKRQGLSTLRAVDVENVLGSSCPNDARKNPWKTCCPSLTGNTNGSRCFTRCPPTSVTLKSLKVDKFSLAADPLSILAGIPTDVVPSADPMNANRAKADQTIAEALAATNATPTLKGYTATLRSLDLAIRADMCLLPFSDAAAQRPI